MGCKVRNSKNSIERLLEGESKANLDFTDAACKSMSPL